MNSSFWAKNAWLDCITHSVNMNLGKLWEMVRDREAWHAPVHRVGKSRTQFGDWTPTRCQTHIGSFNPHYSHVVGPIIIPAVQERKVNSGRESNLTEITRHQARRAGSKSRQVSSRVHDQQPCNEKGTSRPQRSPGDVEKGTSRPQGPLALFLRALMKPLPSRDGILWLHGWKQWCSGFI